MDYSLDACVGDGNIRLYTFEDCIAKKNRTIMKGWDEALNNKEFVKKSIELFHLLTYLDINGDLENVSKITPNEPGDFLVTMNGRDILYEVVTVFGDIGAKSITDLVKEILGINDVSQIGVNEYPVMDTDKLSILFKRILSEKKEKPYFLNYKESVLLLVTSEHDRCGTSPWYLVENFEKDVKDFVSKTQSFIQTMNYFSSGKDGNPITNNIEKEIHVYNKLFEEI